MNQAGGALPNKSVFDQTSAGMMVGVIGYVCFSFRDNNTGMRVWVDPSKGATVIRWPYTAVRGHSGLKSGIASEEKDMGERHKNREISNVENALRICILK